MSEEKDLQDDESMDLMHEAENALQMSAESALSRQHSSESSDDGHWSSDSSSEDEGFALRLETGTCMSKFEDESGGEDSDEPPEIPGSPIAQNLQGGGSTGTTDLGAVVSNTKLSPSKAQMKTLSTFAADDDEYEVKEEEEPRAAEFHASSSSDEEGESGGRYDHERNKVHLEMERSTLSRPKTAAKDLEKYRDAVPNDFFQQFVDTTANGDASASPSTVDGDASSKGDFSSNDRPQVFRVDHGNESLEEQEYAVHVPREVEELFSLSDAYAPEEIEIETRLEPFLPHFTPSVGVPFDGIQIPRPDGKENDIGVKVLREPSGETNVVELELFMQINRTFQTKRKTEVVRSIEWAAQRPQHIDQWISSVQTVQRTKPLAQVQYKQPMPPLSLLLELWPEEFEESLSAHGAAFPAMSELDVSLQELARIVCVILDIPVYEGNSVQSLHVLFSLYLEMQVDERNALLQQGSQR